MVSLCVMLLKAFYHDLLVNSVCFVLFASVHCWAYMAKKGFVSIIPKFKNMQ